MPRASARTILLATTILVGYLFLSIFSVFHMAHMSAMGMPMDHCPYMVGEQSLCAMNTTDHLIVWQQQFSSALFHSFVMILSLIPLVGIVLWYYSPPDPFLLYKKQHRQNFAPPLHQMLFSQGLLNPKPY
jgi:hypothetical protein